MVEKIKVRSPKFQHEVSRRGKKFSRRQLLQTAAAVAIPGVILPRTTAIADTFDKPDAGPIKDSIEMWLYTLNMAPEFQSAWDFGFHGAPAIPAGFFGPGSDPWAGTINCVGIPKDLKGKTRAADTIVTHERLVWVPNPNKRIGPAEIPGKYIIRCALTAMTEKGTKPISVTYDRGKREEKWSVTAKLSDDHPGGGHIEITRVAPDGNGGLCDIHIAIKVDFTFKSLPPAKPATAVLRPDVEWLSETDHPFSRWVDKSTLQSFTISPDSNGTFVPASRTVGGRTTRRACNSKSLRVQHSFFLPPNDPVEVTGVVNEVTTFPF